MGFRDEYWDLFPAGDLQRLRGIADSRAANLVEHFGEMPDSILKIVQGACGVSLTDSQATIAKEAGLRLACEGCPTLATLVERWAPIQDLSEFSTAVTRTMLPS